MSKSIYLDYAAATPVDKRVSRAMEPYLSNKFYNPSALYLASKEVKQTIYESRATIAKILGAKPSEVIFVAGATEANNIAILGVLDSYQNTNILVSAIEHKSVINTAKQFSHKIIKVNKEGIVKLDDLKKQINNQTVLISLMYANNEIGTLQPIKEVSKIVREVRSQRQKQNNPLPIYLHTDAVQAVNYLNILVNELGVDLMTISGSKIYGPKQTGCLYIKTGVSIKSPFYGGGQESGLRSGTENVAGIVGLTEALKIADESKKIESQRMRLLQKQFIDKLTLLIPSSTINGSLKHRLPNNVHITLPGTDNERLLMELDEQGVMCGIGSACSASSDEPSYVLKAIGLDDKQARSTLRFTFGRHTNEQQINKTVTILSKLYL